MWVFILGAIISLGAGIGYHLLLVNTHTRQMRQAVELSETDQTLTILESIRMQASAADWIAVQSKFQRLDRLLLSHQLILLAPNGSILADSASDQPSGLTPANTIQPAASGTVDIRWLSDNDILQIAVPVINENQEVVAILLNRRNFQQEFNTLRASQKNFLFGYVLLHLALIAIATALFAWFLLHPLDQIYRLALAISQGSKRVRAPDLPGLEFRRVTNAFNLMIDHLTSQRTTLEDLNSQLESVLVERNRALETSSQAVRERARQLEALNAVITTAASTLDLDTLVRQTLEQTLQILNSSCGAIYVKEHAAVRGLPEDANEKIAHAINASRQSPAEHIVVENWEAPLPANLSLLSGVMLAMSVKAAMIIPIFSGTEITGHISVADTQSRAWSPEENSLLEIIANKIGISTERTHYIQDIQNHNLLMKTLVAQSELLNRPFTTEDVIAAIGQGVLLLCNADSIAILQPDQSGKFGCTWSEGVSQRVLDVLLAQPEAFSLPVMLNNPAPVQIPAPALVDERIRSVSIWPMVYEGQVNALACCFYDQKAAWKPNEQEVIDAFFHQAAAAIENARLFEAEYSQRRLAEAVQEISGTLTSTLDLEEVLDRILESLDQVSPHDAADIMLIDNGWLRIVRWRGQPPEVAEALQEWKYPLDGLPTVQEMLQNQRALVVPDVSEQKDWVDLPISRWIGSYAGAPIFHRGEALGIVNIVSAQAGFFSPEIGPRLQTFANQAAIAIGNARIYQRTQQRAAETNALYRAMLPLFNPDEDLSALARQITQSVTEEFASAHCSLLLIDENKTRLVLAAQSGYEQPQVTVLPLNGPGLTVKAINTRQVIYAPDVRLEPSYVPGARETRSELAIPLHARDHFLGVLNLESPQVNAFDAGAQRLLSSYAERAALGLENARLFAAIRRHAEQMIQLNDLTRIALQTTQLAGVRSDLARQVARMMHSDGCYITQWNEDLQQAIPFTAYGPNDSIYTSLKVEAGDLTLTESALEQGRTLIIDDIYDTPYLSPHLASTYPVKSFLVAPLIVNGVKMGAVLVGYADRHVFTPDEVALGEQAAGQIALALAKLQSLDIAQQRAHEAENLQQASIALTSSLDLSEVLDSILNHLEKAIPFDSACIFLEKQDYFQISAAKNLHQSEHTLARNFPRDNELFCLIESTLQPVTLPDARQDPRFEQWGTNSVCSWMGVPLTTGNNLEGILTLDRHNVNPFSPAEIKLTRSFANHAAVAVQNARLYQEAQQQARELEALHTATTSLVTTLNLDTLLERILEAAMSAIPASQAANLHLLDLNSGRLQVRLSRGLSGSASEVEQLLNEQDRWAHILDEQHPLLIQEARPGGDSNNGYLSAIVAPLIQETETIGMLSLVATQEGAFSEGDFRLLASFASTAAAAMQNAQLHSAVQYLAITDPLTGVNNRRGFFEQARQVINTAEIYDRPVSVLMLDIDFFKHVNDEFGHDAGDTILQALAERSRKVLRDSDLICRYGGEEFAYLLPESDLEGARIATRRLFDAITGNPVQTINGPVTFTISIGVATRNESCFTLDDLLKCADSALFQAKQSGRNQVRFWQQNPSLGF